MNFDGLRPYVRVAETYCSYLVLMAEGKAQGIPLHPETTLIIDRFFGKPPTAIQGWCEHEAVRRWLKQKEAPCPKR